MVRPRRLVAGSLQVVLFTLFTAVSASAQVPVFQQVPNLGTYSIGQLQQPLSAIGGDGVNYSWEVVSGSLPAGTSLRTDRDTWWFSNASVGIVGLATTPGPSSFTLRVTSGGQSATRTFTMKITALTVETPWNVPDAFVGKPYTPFQLTAVNNVGPAVWTLTSTLPPGMTMVNGRLSGTPTATGVYNVTFTLSDGVDTIYRSVTLYIYQIEITTPGLLPNATQNVPYTTTLTASGGSAPYRFSSCSRLSPIECSGGSVLPFGLVLDEESGTLSGTPTSIGRVSFDVTVTDANHVSYVKKLAIDVVGVPPALPRVTPYGATLGECSLGQPCALGVGVDSGGTAPFTWTAEGLPQGMFIQPGGLTQWWINPGDGEIVGTPTQTGSFNVKLTVTDAQGVSSSNTFALIVPRLAVSNYLPNGAYGVPYSVQFRVLGGASQPAAIPGPATTDYTTVYTAEFVAGRLPAGLTFDLATFTLSGTPLENGSFGPIDIRFTDHGSPAESHVIRRYFFIESPPQSTIQITSGNDLGTAVLNQTFSRQLFACCVPSYAWAVAGGTLPPGMTLSTAGVLSGSPTSIGTYQFLVQAADATFPANYGIRHFTLQVVPILLSITPTTLTFGNVGSSYNVTFAATGGNGTYNWALSPLTYLPPGVTLSLNGVLSGTPTATGQFTFTVNASDTNGLAGLRFYSLSIYPAGAVPPLNLPLGPNLTLNVGTQVFSLAATGGVPPYHYSQTQGSPVFPGMRVQDGPPLPTAFTATGAFMGVIAQVGTASTSIRVTDAAGTAFDRAVTITVPTVRLMSETPLPKATLNQPYSFTLRAYGGSGNYTWAVSTTSLFPPGLTLDALGRISGTPTVAGSYFPIILLGDAATSSVMSASVTITVDPFAITSSGVLPQGVVGTSYSYPLTAPGCASPCNWSVSSGALPSGFSLSQGGTITGTPTGTFTGSFTLNASGSNGNVSKLFSLRIVSSTPQALSISNSATIGPTVVGGSGTNQLAANGGIPPYTWSLRAGDVLPVGVVLESAGETAGANLAPGLAYLQGRVMQVGISTFTLDVRDAAGTTVSRTFTWNVSGLSNQYSNLPLAGTTLVYNTAYSQPLLVIGGTSHYTWTNLAAMPSGLSLNANTGVVSGTPLNTGSFTVPIQATDDGGNITTANISFIVSGPTTTTLGFASGATLSTVSQASTASFTVTPTGGTPPYTMTLLSSLPSGFLLLAGDSPPSGPSAGPFTVTGIPQAPGTYTFTLQAQDSVGNLGVRTFTFKVASFAVLSQTLADASVGQSYSQALTTFDNTGAVTWAALSGSVLPPGVTVSAGGVISGTPTQAGTYVFTLSGTDAGGTILNFGFSLRVSALAIPDAPVLPMAIAGEPYSYTFTATGAGTPVWSATGLPAGLTIAPSGTISGTTNSTGTFAVIVTATDGVVPVSVRFTMFSRQPNPTVLDYPVFGTALLDVTVGQIVQVTPVPSGGVPPYAWSVAAGSTLPPGLRLISGAAVPSTATPGSTLLAGTASAAGAYTFDLIVTDAAGVQMRRTFTLNVTEIGLLTGIRSGTAGVAFAQQFTAVGGSAPYTFSITPISATIDMLPPGYSLSASGLLSGTTTSTGSYTFALRAQDSAGRAFTRRYTLVVGNPQGLRITSSNPSDVSVGVGRSMTLVTSGSSSYSWSVVSGSLPPGFALVLSGGATLLSGASPVAGLYTFTLRATDTANAANTADHAFTFKVVPMQVVALPTGELPVGQVGAPYTYTFRTAGGTPPYSYAASPFFPIPPGLSLSASGVLSGTPQQIGNYLAALVISDSSGQVYSTGTASLVVTSPSTAPPLLRSGVSTLQTASVGVPYVFALDLSLLRGGTAPFTWSLAGASLPAGMTLLQGFNGVQSYIGGAPDAAGSYSTTLIATDATGQSLTVPITINVTTLAMTPDALPPASVGAPYLAVITPSGGTAPYALQLNLGSGLPPGLSLSANGTLSGTPTAPGQFVINVAAFDSASKTITKPYRFIVNNAAGQVAGVYVSPRPIQVYYESGSAPPSSILVSVTTTSAALPYRLAVLGVPGATILPATGTTPAVASLNIAVSGLGIGTYTGVLSAAVPDAVNRFDSVPVTLTVAPPPPCTYTLNPASRTALATFGFGGFSVQTASNCSWTATTTTPWITINPVTASGTGGPKTVSYQVAANPGVTERIGTVTVNGQTHSVTQFGTACSFSMTPGIVGATSASGVAQVSLVASSAACAWSSSSTGLTIVPASGTGGGLVSVTIPANPDPASRVLSATIAGQSLNVNQTGIACTVALGSYEAAAPAGGAQGSVSVATQSGCSYSTVMGPSWISVTSGGSGDGPGTLVFAVDPNSRTESRSGTLTIGGQPFRITQDALACSVTVQTSSLGSPYGSTGGAGTIGVTANGASCSWSAAADVPWATLSPFSGTGTGTIGIALGSNASSQTGRSGTVTINGQTLNVSQAGTVCTYALQSSTGSIPGVGGAGSVGVVSAAVCTWGSVSNNSDWLTITSSGNVGTADVRFSAQVNPSAAPRTGSLTVAGQLYTVTQAGAPCSYTLGLSSTSVASDGLASGSFGFSTTAGCSPAPLSFVNWVTVNSTSFGGTTGTVSYSVAPNPLSVNRVGTIQVGDRAFTITQLGGQCGYSLGAYGALYGPAGGRGSVRGSQSALGCTPAVGTDQPSFVLLDALTGPTNNIFTLPFDIDQFSALTRSTRIGRIVFGGVTFTVKQTSY